VSRRAKGPRLWLRPARYDAGKLTHEPAWVILDGTRQRGTGLGIGASPEEKETALRLYLQSKHTESVSTGTRDPSQIEIADVLAKYLRDVVSPAPAEPGHRRASHNGHARPEESAKRIERLSAFWGSRRLSSVTGDTCREYIAKRSTDAAARRELEELRAAINHHRREGLHDRIVSVVLPPKSPPRERYLERTEAAALIRSAWRYQETQNFRATERRTRRHVARFMVVARYMGSRAAVICGASIEPKRPPGQPWIDLAHGVFYGRPTGERETKKRRQRVRVPLPLLAHLRRWRARGQRYAVEWNGQPVGRVNKAHDAVVKAAGLGQDVTPHVWRHTVATWLMQSGADPFKVAPFLGMSFETLTRVYGHHRPNDSADIHDALRQRLPNDRREQKTKPAPSNVSEIVVDAVSA